MKRRLPPLNAIRAFEAAARLESISEAAEELSVTPTAISHQIRHLENLLDIKLFERAGRNISLTDQGARMLPDITRGMDSLAAQIRFYQSAKSPTRALMIEKDDGSTEILSGQKVQSLCLHMPGQPQDHVIYGKPEALAAIASALAATGQTVTGPAPVHDHAELLAENSPGPAKADVT